MKGLLMDGNAKKKVCRGFTLVELLVVIGIIAVLIGMLLPSLTRARAQAMSVQCKSNMRTVGTALLMYCNENKGWLFPVGDVTYDAQGKPHAKTFGYDGPTTPDNHPWTYVVFGRTDPPQMLCPADAGQFPEVDRNGDIIKPIFWHSYLLNQHLADRRIKYTASSMQMAGKTSSEVVVMGEKKLDVMDYCMEDADFNVSDGGKVDLFKHGLSMGANYLYLDLHVSSDPPKEVQKGLDPWDIAPSTSPSTSPGT